MMTYTPSYKLCKALHGLHPNIINPECNTNPVQSAIFHHSQVLWPNLTIKGLALFLCPSTGVIIHKAYFCQSAHVIKNHNVSLLCKVSQVCELLHSEPFTAVSLTLLQMEFILSYSFYRKYTSLY